VSGNPGELDALLELYPNGRDQWRGRGRPAYGTRVFGGHVLAHAVRASSTAQQSDRPVNSLHAYFLAAAHAGDDINYCVSTIKQGRSLDVHQVIAGQDRRPVVLCAVSYHSAEPGAGFQKATPTVPWPTELEAVTYTPPGTHAEVRAPFELRYADGRFRDENGPDTRPTLDTWIRARHPVQSGAQPDHAALLAYAVDFLITRVAHMPVRDDASLVGASLDHAMWFHRPFRVDDWLLVSCSSSTLAGARSLSRAEIFDERGHLVATAVQEALLRGQQPAGTIASK
jgi:acyl-CoA thioesterase-2